MEQVSTRVAEYSVTEAALAELAKRFKGATFEVTTRDGMKLAKAARMELRTLRTSLEAKRVAIKRPLLEQVTLIDGEAKRITRELAALEDPIDTQIKAQERIEDEKREAAEKADAERRAAIVKRITNIERLPTTCLGAKAAAIALVLDAHRRDEPEEWAQEYLPQAKQEHLTALQQLEKMHAGSLVAEAEALRQAEERARLAAEQKRLDEERAKLEAEKRAQQARIDAEERAAAQRIAEAEAKVRAERQAEEDRLRAERMRLEDEQRARDAEARRQREAEEERAAAVQREAQRKGNELMDARQMLVTFRERFGHLQQFETVVAEIDACLAVPA